ncbi:hypothetical protein [Bradyrhizobium sp. 131]|uniref:hypothetical protein n=1 Tax=Bradyrhizobium sp. 131 TaxID=2782609 RepID=UPI001FFF1DAA|nr:hypothetical protein [Bradyrhizobium sp. 131]UPK20591.1 hypothetical protein IVA73_06150 [Bradyrhizobium sp. 131]
MKTLVNPLQVSRFLQKYDRAAVEKGLTVFVGFDFHEYVSITRATPTKDPTYPNFRPDRSPIKSGEGYWIKGHDENNKVAFLGAARLYDLSESNFAEHVESLKAFYAEPALHAHPQDRCSCSAPSAKKIVGKVAYHGDLWVREDLRGKGLPKIISGLQRGVSFCMWAPDFLCAFVARWLVDKGVSQMLHCEPGGSVLQLVGENISHDEWLVWLTGEELRSLVYQHDRIADP